MRVLAVVVLLARAAHAQVEYYNLDVGRPLLIADAYPVEHYAWDAQVAPSALWSAGGAATSAIETAVAWGALARTQVDLGATLASAPRAVGSREYGISGFQLGVLYNLNTETLRLPALAVAARAVLPVGPLAPSSPLVTLGGLATRSWAGVRLNVNAAVTIGSDDGAMVAADHPRWYAGAAVDHAWPLSAVLVAAEIVASQPTAAGSALAWTGGAGARWQWTPRLVLDAGITSRFAGDDRGWGATVGMTWSFAVRALMPVAR